MREGAPTDAIIYDLELQMLPVDVVEYLPGDDCRRILKDKGSRYARVNV